MAAAKKSAGEPRAVPLIEEAVHLLRRHPGELALYVATTGPFAIFLLFGWAYVTWFGPTDGAIAAGAMVLAGLFAFMKAGQQHFTRRLLARRMDAEPPRWSWRALPSAMAAQLRLHALALPILAVAALVTVPFGWVFAYFQNATILETGSEGTAATRKLAWEQARLWPAQNHRALLILSGLGLLVFINVAVSFYALPSLATNLLGLRTIFATSGWSYFNTTFLFLVTVLTYLLVDPLTRTFYVLRVFYGQARRTGADLQQALARQERQRKARLNRAAVVVALVVASGLGGIPMPLSAAEAPAPVVVSPATGVPPAELDRSLDRVLAERDFRWRLRPKPGAKPDKPDGLIKGFVRTCFEAIKELSRALSRTIGRLINWIRSWFPERRVKDPVSGARTPGTVSADWMAIFQVAAYVLLALVGVLLVWSAIALWRKHRAIAPLSAAPEAAVAPDLRDETVEASRLPADGWLDLARQQMAAGEWRLALRALFLATLARLAHERLVTLAKSKTNLDYERELTRRAHGQTERVAGFRQRRREFEEVWYGDATTQSERVTAWLRELEVPS